MNNKTHIFDEKSLKAIKDLERVIGEPITVILGSSDGSKESVSHYYSGKLPPLVIETANAKREIKVEVSSIDQENNEMLHYLFRNTIES